ncbi:hypothetical protein AYK26_03695 [Euryarchaeota archaeon SM23-78]|nr:MAG: hypothetical protein AYK26_03695 [Euryarchaeota archaeon SM23-78]MBW3000657.1 PHP domain-containing protein [Candidatus Woesearchaeota archaeon]
MNRVFSDRIIFQEPCMNELRKQYTFVDMHVHSKYSHDSITNVRNLLKKAGKLRIGLSITDHVRAEGALEACRQKKVLVIPGIEIASKENKEILLYFYDAKDLREYYEKYLKHKMIFHKPSKSKLVKTLRAVRSAMKMSDIIEKANNYNCLICVPHPYTYLKRSSYLFFGRKKRADLLRRIDAVEVLNSTHRKFMNKRALKWAFKKNKAFTGGSDAHILSELGSTVVASKGDSVESFLNSVKKRNNFVIGSELKFPRAMKEVIKSMGYKRKKDWKKIYNV